MLQCLSVIVLLGVCIVGSNGQYFNTRPFPTYSLENMPDTGFSCREKILGGYYADSETQCQMFHVCVKVAGIGVQDFRFLCPNGTAFDQEAQICAEWDDVDCEAATLYYSSDNFDLYRIGSGFESKAAPYTGEDESTFQLQRADTGDTRLSREHQVTRTNQRPEFNVQSPAKDLFRGSSSSNFFNNRNGGKEEDDDYEAPQENINRNVNQVPRQQKVVRKLNRKPVTTTTTTTTTTTRAPPPSQSDYTQASTYKPATRYQQKSSARTFQNNFAGSSYIPTTTKPATTNAVTEEQYTVAINNYKTRQQSGRQNFRTGGRQDYESQREQVSNNDNNSQYDNGRQSNQNRRPINQFSTNIQYDNKQSTQYTTQHTTTAAPSTSRQTAQYQTINRQQTNFNTNQYTPSSTSTPFNKETHYSNFENARISTQKYNDYKSTASNKQISNNGDYSDSKTSSQYYDNGQYNKQTTQYDNTQYKEKQTTQYNNKQSSQFNTQQTSTASGQYNSQYNSKQTNQYYNTQTTPSSTQYNNGQYNNKQNNQYNNQQTTPAAGQYNAQTTPVRQTTTYNNGQYNQPATNKVTTQFASRQTDFESDISRISTSTPSNVQYKATSQYNDKSTFKDQFNKQTTVNTQYNPSSVQPKQVTQTKPPVYTQITTSTQRYQQTGDYNPANYDEGQYVDEKSNGKYIEDKKPTTYRQPQVTSTSPRNIIKTDYQEESLKTAHSTNFASSRNEYTQNSKSTQNAVSTTQKSYESPRPFSVNPNIPQSTSVRPKTNPQPSKKDKNVSYDYAYYDSGDSHPVDYDSIGTDFEKTAKKL